MQLLSTEPDRICSNHPGSSNARCTDRSTRTQRASRLIRRTSCLHKRTRNQVNPNRVAPEASKMQKIHEDADEMARCPSHRALNLRLNAPQRPGPQWATFVVLCCFWSQAANAENLPDRSCWPRCRSPTSAATYHC